MESSPDVMTSKNLFEAAPFFLLRAPLWSSKDLEQLFQTDDPLESALHLFNSNSFLREAILTASPSLYNGLKVNAEKNRRELASSLLNYIIRLCTRPTPFGLFSCVTFGGWGMTTETYFDPKKVYKKARPDAEWLFSFLSNPHQEHEKLISQSVRTNPLVWIAGEKCHLSDFIRLKKSTENPKTISINANPLVMSILSLSKKKLLVKDLWEGLVAQLPDLDRGKALDVISTLLHQQFLLPGKLPSLLGEDIYKPLLPEDLCKKIAQLSEISPGEGEQSLHHVSGEMKQLAETDTPLQVDTAYPANSLHIGSSVKEEIERALSLWWQVSTALNLPTSHLQYLNKFTEKYGTQRTVPLFEMLCETKGIGDPFSDTNQNPQSPPSEFLSVWEKEIQRRWQEALQEGSKEIQITQEEIDTLFSFCEKESPSNEETPAAFDAFFKIFAKSQRAIDRGDFLLQFSDFNWQVGSSFGRFLHLFDKTSKEELRKVLRRAESQDSDALFAEVSFWPLEARLGNVVAYPCLRDYRVDLFEEIDSKKNISLDDIYVGSTGERFYFTLKDGHQELIPTFGNFLNPKLSPAPIRFLREALYLKDRFIYPFSFKRHVQHAIFTPRVRLGKTILSVAKWYLEGQSFQKKAKNEVRKDFLCWAERWSLPDQFLLTVGDQQLQLDRNSTHGLKLILQKLQKGQSLEFSEVIASGWLKSSRGAHNAEIVVPMQKSAAMPSAIKRVHLHPHQEVSLEKRLKLPGSDWLYYKIYLQNDAMDRFLVQNLAPIGSHFCQEGIVKKWHFIRYHDPNCHFRFRMQLKNPADLSKVVTSMEPIIHNWIQHGLVKEVGIFGYEREVERYGGEASLQMMESIFHDDSELIAELLLAQVTKKLSLSSLALYSWSVIHFLDAFFTSQEKILEFLSTKKIDRSHLKGYRTHKNEISTSILSPPVNLSYDLSKTGSLDLEIIRSLLHMHCNRLGCNRFQENQAYLYAQKALQERRAQNKDKKRNEEMSSTK